MKLYPEWECKMSVKFETMNVNKNGTTLSLQGRVRDGNNLLGSFQSRHDSDGYFEAVAQRQSNNNIEYVIYPDGSRVEGLSRDFKVSIPADGRKSATVTDVDSEPLGTVDEYIKNGKCPAFVKNVVDDCRIWVKAFHKELDNHKSINH